MTLAAIERCWSQRGAEADKRARWRALAARGWLAACREAVRAGDVDTLWAWLGRDRPTRRGIVEFDGPASAAMVRAHFWCGLVACLAQRGAWSRCVEWPELIAALTACAAKAVRELASAWEFDTRAAAHGHTAAPVESRRLAGLPRRLAARPEADLAERVFHRFADSLAHPDDHRACHFLGDLARTMLGAQRGAERAVPTAVPLVHGEETGVIATLTLESLGHGDGAFYPDPRLAFVTRDARLRGAEASARRAVEDLLPGVVGAGDARWRLTGTPVVPVEGDSIGLALALCLGALTGDPGRAHRGAATGGYEARARACRDPFGRLRSCLSAVAVTAALKPDGILVPVGGLHPKAVAAARAGLHTLVVADSQDLSDITLVPLRGQPSVYGVRGTELHVIRARTLAEAAALVVRRASPLHEPGSPTVRTSGASRAADAADRVRLSIRATIDVPAATLRELLHARKAR